MFSFFLYILFSVLTLYLILLPLLLHTFEYDPIFAIKTFLKIIKLQIKKWGEQVAVNTDKAEVLLLQLNYTKSFFQSLKCIYICGW